MRVAFAAMTDRRSGGLEAYVEAVLGALAGDGHDVALWHESTGPERHERIALPEGAARSRIDSLAALSAAFAWRPDAIVVNGLTNPEVEEGLLARRAAVFVAHNYYGSCISGTRAWTFPVVRPCPRTFGAACLLHYFPHRCGGRSPVTMARLYLRERRRLQAIGRAAAVITYSRHMRDVYLAHGIEPSRVVHLPYGPGPSAAPVPGPSARSGDPALRLAVMARLERLKGVHLLLDALPHVRRFTRAPVSLVVLGDGSARPALERQAEALMAGDADIRVSFAGWVSPGERDRLLNGAGMLVVPSAWPEPLGMVGDEAAHLALPVVAYDVGGVRDWLEDGVNGRLVPADPPAPEPLARAIAELFADPSALARLGAAGRERARQRTPALHARALAAVLESLSLQAAGHPR